MSSTPPLAADIASFDARAATWDDNPTRGHLIAAIAAAIARRAPPQAGWRAFEYGCGTAALGICLAPHLGRLVAADASAGMIAQVRQKIAAAGLTHVEPRVLDLTRDPPPAERFDLVMSAMTLHHIADPAALLRGLARLLAPGGTLALADLVTEDGSFHADTTVPHHGFDPAMLAGILTAAGLSDARWEIVHEIKRDARAYPIFLLTATAPAKPRLRVLFLCTGNSCRSQMAEGWAHALKSDTIEAYSAGIQKHGLNPNAVQVMAEAGVDIRAQHSKTVDELAGVDFDYVVTVCGHAHETCPVWLKGKARVVHVGFDDPPALARDARTLAEALSHYRRVRDEIKAFVSRLPNGLG